MKPPADTDPAAHRAQVEAWRRMGPRARLAQAVELSEATRRITRAGRAEVSRGGPAPRSVPATG